MFAIIDVCQPIVGFSLAISLAIRLYAIARPAGYQVIIILIIILVMILTNIIIFLIITLLIFSCPSSSVPTWTNFHNFDQISQFWPFFFTLVTKFHICDQISQFWQNVTIFCRQCREYRQWKNAEITDNSDNAGHADHADNAANADNADNLYNYWLTVKADF